MTPITQFMHQVKFTMFGLKIFLLVVGTVFNLTLKLTNATYDESLASPHSPQFIKLRTDFEVGVSIEAKRNAMFCRHEIWCDISLKIYTC